MTGDEPGSILCTDCKERHKHGPNITCCCYPRGNTCLRKTTVDVNSLGDDGVSDTSADDTDYLSSDEDVNQLRILIEITTGKRIFPSVPKARISPIKPKEIISTNHNVRKRKKRRKPKLADVKSSAAEASKLIDKRVAKVSEKFKEVKIRPNHSR